MDETLAKLDKNVKPPWPMTNPVQKTIPKDNPVQKTTAKTD